MTSVRSCPRTHTHRPCADSVIARTDAGTERGASHEGPPQPRRDAESFPGARAGERSLLGGLQLLSRRGRLPRSSVDNRGRAFDHPPTWEVVRNDGLKGNFPALPERRRERSPLLAERDDRKSARYGHGTARQIHLKHGVRCDHPRSTSADGRNRSPPPPPHRTKISGSRRSPAGTSYTPPTSTFSRPYGTLRFRNTKIGKSTRRTHQPLTEQSRAAQS